MVRSWDIVNGFWGFFLSCVFFTLRWKKIYLLLYKATKLILLHFCFPFPAFCMSVSASKSATCFSNSLMIDVSLLIISEKKDSFYSEKIINNRWLWNVDREKSSSGFVGVWSGSRCCKPSRKASQDTVGSNCQGHAQNSGGASMHLSCMWRFL